MAERTERDWEAATWNGSRRAQLRRTLRLTPRERLEAMIELERTAQELGSCARIVTGSRQRDRSSRD